MREELDEYGYPKEWRWDQPSSIPLESEPGWEVFKQWARQRDVPAFPASVETVLEFLLDESLPEEARASGYRGVDLRHDRDYWYTDANPACILNLWGVKEYEGQLIIPNAIEERASRAAGARPSRAGHPTQRGGYRDPDLNLEPPGPPDPRSLPGPAQLLRRSLLPWKRKRAR